MDGAPDPVIRSIRIAVTLTERFSSILRTGADDVATMELQIGEAQQLYPEIWRHLDDARTSLAARGADLAAYDAVRSTYEPGELAVTDIDTSQSVNVLGLAFGSIGYVETKTATFNAEGHRRARQACTALMDAMPEVDWNALERAEHAEIAAAGSLTSARWKNLAIGGGVALALVLAVLGARALLTAAPAEPTPAELRREAREATRDKVGEARQLRIEELREALRAKRCDRPIAAELRQLLVEDGQTGAATDLVASYRKYCEPEGGSATADP